MGSPAEGSSGPCSHAVPQDDRDRDSYFTHSVSGPTPPPPPPPPPPGICFQSTDRRNQRNSLRNFSLAIPRSDIYYSCPYFIDQNSITWSHQICKVAWKCSLVMKEENKFGEQSVPQTVLEFIPVFYRLSSKSVILLECFPSSL